MRHIGEPETQDKIRAFMMDKSGVVVLTEAVEKIRLRWLAAWDKLVSEQMSDMDVATWLQEQFGVSVATSYNDIRECKQLFGDLQRTSKNALRFMVTQGCFDLIKKAREAGDLKGAAALYDKIIKANNLDVEDVDLPDPSKIQPPTQILQINIDFLTSEFAQVIDEKAKEKINELLGLIQKTLEEHRISDYLSEKTIEIPFIKADESDS